MAKATALQVAEYFVKKALAEESGDAMSNLKLQKLLYYAQGYHLGAYGKPLFSEQILAWEHGPVVRSVYDAYRGFGRRGIDIPEEVGLDDFDESLMDFLDQVYAHVGQYSAWKLRDMTHNEPPWKDAKRNATITQAALKAHFKGLVKS